MPKHFTKLDRATRSYDQWVRRENRRRARDGWEPATVDTGFLNGWFLGYEAARRKMELVKSCKGCGQLFCKGCATTRELETGVCSECAKLGDYEAEHRQEARDVL